MNAPTAPGPSFSLYSRQSPLYKALPHSCAACRRMSGGRRVVRRLAGCVSKPVLTSASSEFFAAGQSLSWLRGFQQLSKPVGSTSTVFVHNLELYRKPQLAVISQRTKLQPGLFRGGSLPEALRCFYDAVVSGGRDLLGSNCCY